VLDWHTIIANHFEKFESACMSGAVAWTQCAEHLVNRSVLVAPSNGNEYARWIVAERRRKTCLFFGGQASGRQIGRTEPRDQVGREHLNHFAAIFFVRVDDLHKSRTPKRSQSQKAGAESGARLAVQVGWVATRENEGTGYGPLARLGRFFKEKSV